LEGPIYLCQTSTCEEEMSAGIRMVLRWGAIREKVRNFLPQGGARTKERRRGLLRKRRSLKKKGRGGFPAGFSLSG